MNFNILFLLGTLLYCVPTTLCQFQIRHEQRAVVIEGTTITITQAQVNTAPDSQALATTVTNSQAEETTSITITISQAPATTVTIPQAPATTVTNSHASETTIVTNPPPPATTITAATAPPAPATTATPTSSQPAATTTASPQAPATTAAPSTILTTSRASVPTATTSGASNLPSSQATVVSASSQPVPTTFSTRPSAAATSITIPTSSQLATPNSTPSATATGRQPRDLRKLVLDALQGVPDADRFAAALKESVPSVFDLLDPESDYTIFAPNNAAMEREGQGLKRGEGELTPKLALSFAKRGNTNEPLTFRPSTVNTVLSDGQYVNLGPGEPAKIVLLPLDKNFNIATGGNGTHLRIVSGMGNFTVARQEYNIEAGAIETVDSLPALPQDLSTTLRGTGGTEFEKFLSNSNQLGTLSNSPGVTIFALNDTTMASVRNNFTNATLGQHIILGFPGYTPSFNLEIPYNTAAGNEIVVKKNGTNYFVNGVKIVRPDVITKNGVVHYVERIIEPGPRQSSSTPSPSSTSKAHSSAGRPAVSPFITILAAVAALTRYCLMA